MWAAVLVKEENNQTKSQTRKKVSFCLSLTGEQAVQINTEYKKYQQLCVYLGQTMANGLCMDNMGTMQVTSPWTEICGTHLSAVVWQSSLLSLHLPWHNQQKLWLVGPPVTYTDKLQQPIRAQKGCPDHVCGHSERCDLLFQLFKPFAILMTGLFGSMWA